MVAHYVGEDSHVVVLFHPHAVGYVPHYGRFLMFGLTGLTGLSGRFSNVDHTSRPISSYQSS